ncbi:hypothetical protein ACH4VR_13085 [Streptomyces sp. NPDC020883]|uniref:hypothetical protein n=1 Tax=Streptomyces sp. NPDC020883 TaxID=3365099 RepID=UPI00379DEAC8
MAGESRTRLMYDNNKSIESIADGARTLIRPLDPTPTVSEVTPKALPCASLSADLTTETDYPRGPNT